MPLKRGKSHIGDNIKELELHGTRKRSHKQIVAIALHKAYDDGDGDESPMDKVKAARKRGAKLKKAGSKNGKHLTLPKETWANV